MFSNLPVLFGFCTLKKRVGVKKMAEKDANGAKITSPWKITLLVIGDILFIEHPEIIGVFEEIGWSMNLEPNGKMIHTLRRIITA